jgi:hypothetical protein
MPSFFVSPLPTWTPLCLVASPATASELPLRHPDPSRLLDGPSTGLRRKAIRLRPPPDFDLAAPSQVRPVSMFRMPGPEAADRSVAGQRHRA